MTDNFSTLDLPKYNCENCNFICSKKNEWERHNSTRKHINNVSNLQKAPPDYKCRHCEKSYKHRQSLFTHCKNVHNLCDDNEEANNKLDESKEIANLNPNEMMMKLIEQNTELQKQIIEMAKQTSVVNNTNNITNNTMNNHFNLHLFLNDTCKDALNIDDFMNSIQLSIADLEETGRLGFVEGITRIFLQGLKDLDITQRPFHCTDLKRETVYIKDQNKWEKETNEKKLMRQALNQAVRKNLGLLHAWQKEHPDYLRSNTKDNDDYIKISLNSLGSAYEDEQKRMDDKIIRNVLRELVLDKRNFIDSTDEV